MSNLISQLYKLTTCVYIVLKLGYQISCFHTRSILNGFIILSNISDVSLLH